jgi:two-component system response regulator RegA
MSEALEQRTLLVVDDDEPFRTRLMRAFESRGYETRGAADVAEALALAKAESPELAVVDLRMAGGSGLDVVRALHAEDSATRIVVLTGYGSIATAVEAVKLGATHYLTKPASVDDLLAAFDHGSGDAASPPAEVASLARVEWEHINRVLQECGGNISQAARLLGLHRRSLQRKLSKYPVSR